MISSISLMQQRSVASYEISRSLLNLKSHVENNREMSWST